MTNEELEEIEKRFGGAKSTRRSKWRVWSPKALDSGHFRRIFAVLANPARSATSWHWFYHAWMGLQPGRGRNSHGAGANVESGHGVRNEQVPLGMLVLFHTGKTRRLHENTTSLSKPHD